jgi:hypothetical protein
VTKRSGMKQQQLSVESLLFAAETSRKMDPKKKKTMLPPSFKPYQYSVIIGKGKDARNAPGTQKLRDAINTKLEVYKRSSHHRLEKARIVSELLAQQQMRCPSGGAFIKHDGKRWWELSEHDARENITAAFRNRLHENYTSSSKFKSAKRRLQLKAADQSNGPKKKNKKNNPNQKMNSRHIIHKL